LSVRIRFFHHDGTNLPKNIPILPRRCEPKRIGGPVRLAKSMVTDLGVVRLHRRGRHQARRLRAAIRRLPDDRTPADYAIRDVAKLNFRASAERVPARPDHEPPSGEAFTSGAALASCYHVIADMGG
jgi:hypothetical protein